MSQAQIVVAPNTNQQLFQIPVSQSSAESDYNVACTAVISLARFRMISNDFLNKDPYVVPEQAPLIILDIKSVYG